MSFRAVIDAFHLTQPVEAALREAAQDRSLRASRLASYPGGLAGAVLHYGRERNPQVIIVEEDDDRVMLERLEQLAEVCDPGVKVLVIGRLNDIGLYRRLLAGGVSDYLPLPATAPQIVAAISALFADPGAAPRGKTVAVWSVCGGAGGSTLARNLAWHMGRACGEAAIYLDLDVAFGGSDLAFNIEARQGAWDALAQPERLDAVLLDRFLLTHDDHLRILPSGGGAPKICDVAAEAAETLVDMTARMAPVATIDLPHLWSAWTEAILFGADEVIVVARPDLRHLRDCKALFETLAAHRIGAAAPKLALTGVDLCRKTQLGPKDFQETLGAPPALCLPWDSALFGDAANNGQLLEETVKGNKVSALIDAFAAQLTGRQTAREKARGWSLPSWLKG